MSISGEQPGYLEFRVLAGLQSGGRLRLSPGQYLLGNSPRCDIVLEGNGIEPEHALLTVNGQGEAGLQAVAGVLFLPDGREAGQSLALLPTFAVRLGNVWIAVAAEDSPWEDFTPPIPQASEIRSPPQEPTQTTAPPPALPAHVPPGAGWRWHLAAFVLLTLSLCLAGMILFADLAPPIKPSAQSELPGILASVQQTLDGPAWQGRVNARMTGNGKILVTGFVKDKEETLRLENALRRHAGHLLYGLTEEADQLNQANAFLASLDIPLHVENLGGGRLRLVGAAHGVGEAERVAQQLTDKLPAIQDIDLQVLYPDQLEAKFKQMLAASPIANQLSLSRQGDSLLVQGQLDTKAIQAWDGLFRDYNRRYGAILSIEASFTVSADLLPFQIRQIIGGPLPVVITADGARILPGGAYRGYRLVKIEPHRLVFDGPNQIEIER